MKSKPILILILLIFIIIFNFCGQSETENENPTNNELQNIENNTSINTNEDNQLNKNNNTTIDEEGNSDNSSNANSELENTSDDTSDQIEENANNSSEDENQTNNNTLSSNSNESIIVENDLPLYPYRIDALAKRNMYVKNYNNDVIVNEELTQKIDKEKTINYVKDKSLMDKYFPARDIISYDFIAFDETIPEDVKRQFFKDAYEYLLSILPESEIERANKYGMVYLSEIGFDYVEGDTDSAKSIRYTLYKNVKFNRLMLRDPAPYDPLFKAKITSIFEVLLTGRGDGSVLKVEEDFFIKNKQLFLEYLYYAFDNAPQIASASLLDPKYIIEAKYEVRIPSIPYEAIIEYFIKKENRIDGSLFYGLEFLKYPLSEDFIETLYTLYDKSIEIINSDVSITASIEAILQATIASFCIQQSDKKMPRPEEIANFISRNPHLLDTTKDFLKQCLDLMRRGKTRYIMDLMLIIDKYVNFNISYSYSSINDSIFKWDKGNDHIYYTTSAMELKRIRPTLNDNFLIRDLYEMIYESDYPYLADFLYYDTDKIYTYKLMNNKGESKWYILYLDSGYKVNVSEKITKNKNNNIMGLGYYEDFSSKRVLFYINNPDTLYSALISVGLTEGNNDVKILREDYYISSPPMFTDNMPETLLVRGHFDHKLEVNKKTGNVTFKKFPKSIYKKDIKLAIIDLKSGNVIKTIDGSENWQNIIFIPDLDAMYYREGINDYIYYKSFKEKYSYDDTYDFGPKQILELNFSLTKVIFIREVGNTGRDGVYLYDGKKGRSHLIDYADMILFTGASARGTYISYKSLNPFYKEENMFLVRLKYP